MPDLSWSRHLAFIGFAWIVCGVELSHAAPTNDQLRATYRAALAARQAGDQTEYRRLKEGLRDYLLYPYLEYDDYLRDLGKLDIPKLKAFQQRYADSPLARLLHRHWLAYLAKRKRWSQLIEAYDRDIANTALECSYRMALLETGQTSAAYKNLQQLWVVGRSQDDACDPLFERWLVSPYFSPDYAWRRFWLALDNNERTLARYTQRFMKDPARLQAMQQGLDYQRRPEKIAQLTRQQLDTLAQPARTTALRRLSRQDPDHYLAQRERLNLVGDTVADALAIQAVKRMLRSYHERSHHWAERIDPTFESLELLEWRIREALFRQNWSDVGTLLEALPPASRFNDRWRYWQAVYLNQAGAEQQPRGEQIFAELARHRSFYGFLAADRIGSSYNLNNDSEPASATELAQLAAATGLQRARELFLLNQLIDARREWFHATRNASDKEHYQLAQLARGWGWYAQAIRATIAAQHWNNLVLRFPLEYSQQAADAADQNRIDTTWIMAIIRQESAFMADARSPAGAMGLMQLMPATARQTARKARLRYRNSSQLHDAAFNITLGSAYLSQMYRRFDNQRALASAAYNAGPHRVTRWLEERGHLPLDAWIETIPYDETRHYVQNVLSYALIYSDLLGLPKEFMPSHERAPLRP